MPEIDTQERDWDEVFPGPAPGRPRILIAACDDASAGNEVWSQLESDAEADGGAAIEVMRPLAVNAAEALEAGLRTRKEADIMLLDLYVPLGFGGGANDPELRVGVWLAKALGALWDRQDELRDRLLPRPRLVLWTSNWKSSELNHARAFCEVFGGAWVLDKQTQTSQERVRDLRAIVGEAPPIWALPQPSPELKFTDNDAVVLAHAQGDRAQHLVAQDLHLSPKGLRARYTSLARRLGIDVHDANKFPYHNLLERASAAQMSWVPLRYLEDGFGPVQPVFERIAALHGLT